MTSYDLAQILFQELGYAESPGFDPSVSRQNKWHIPGVDSAYFIRNVPIAYFSRLSDANPEHLWQLHRRVWNQSRVPLLYAILPQEIRIYNGYSTPSKTVAELDQESRLLQHLSQLADVETARQAIRRQLLEYDRLHLETGAFWSTTDGQYIRHESRADRRLLRSMDQVRRHLLNRGLSNDLAYALLGRSIFICYLEDRRILTSEWVRHLTKGQADSYREALEEREVTYRLFGSLSERFNGDLFPVSEEEKLAVRQEHLDLLGHFLDGDDLDTGQQSFWPYDFRFIPIELVSGIYDTFLNIDERRKAGTYYTPLALVDFILDETLPPDVIRPDMTILDPACGSGVFLVGAYQRLVAAWQRQYGEVPSARQLAEILQRNIFGVDISPPAVQIAAFNLYLTMLDYLDDLSIHDESFHFPPLVGTNLIVADFFAPSVDEGFAGRGFDRVIGNPPWGRGTLTEESYRWLKEHDRAAGWKQIAQAFLLRAPEFCSEQGEIALLAPAKSTILVTGGSHEEFRQRFFEEYDVRAVINFSALRYELFSESLSPAVAIFYRANLPSSDGQIVVYGVPKPSLFSQQLGAIVLDTTEVKFLERKDLLGNPALWKVALWATPRDAALIEGLSLLPTLREQAERLGWKVAEGIQIGGGDENPAPWLKGMLLLPTKRFRRYIVDMEACEPITIDVFHRPRDPDIVHGPLALIHQSQCQAAFSAGDVVYRHKISGVAGQSGQETYLKWLVAYINSPLARYYHFLTSTSWAVERGTIIHEEYLRMPFLLPDDDDPRLGEFLEHFNQLVSLLQQPNKILTTGHQTLIQQLEADIAEIIFDLYELTPPERQLVQDVLDYGVDFFYWAKRTRRRPDGAKAVRRPDTEMLKSYAETFIETVTALLRYQDQTLNAVVYQDDAPLSIVGFELVSLADAKDVHIIEGTHILQETLRRLDHLLLEQHTSTLYMRRHVRIYEGSWLYLVRPSERRFWTRSQARADADSAVMEWLSTPRVQE